MEFDKALGYAAILGWDDFKKVSNPHSARVEYRTAVGTEVDYLSIWLVDPEGHQNMVCDYWTWTSSGHPSGIRFTGNYSSHPLGLALDFILMNQGQFTRPADACPEGLALINTPTAEESAEAAAWMSGVHGAATNVSRVEPEKAAAL